MHVLVVEDITPIRLMVAYEVTNSGWTPIEASSVANALACWSKVGADAAIVDISLPDGSGVDLISMLRADAPELPVVVHTGYSASDPMIARLPRDIAVIEKPAARTAITDALRSAQMALTSHV